MVDAKKGLIEIKNGPTKQKFMTELHGLLLEIVFTRDRILQKIFAQKVNQWAI